MAKRDYDFGKRIQRRNAKAQADREAVDEAVRSYAGQMMCERCHTEQDHADYCRVCGLARF